MLTCPRRILTAFVIAALACVGGAGPAPAQVDGVHLTVTPYAGYANWAKNINLEDEPTYGVRGGLILYRYFGLEGHYGWTSTQTFHGRTPWSLPLSTDPVEDADVNDYGVNLIVNLRPSAWFVPFLTGGWQEAKIDHATGSPDVLYENGFQVGGGVKLRIGGRLAARVEFRDHLWKFNSPPAPVPPGEDATDNQFYTAGLEIALGGSTGGTSDSDADGVKDKKDKCPNTPAGARVDADGCPIDSDGDGVADGIDQCADTPSGARVDARGCPTDSDGDGVPDGIDQCADTPRGAPVDARGCPTDSDGDGVPDGVDQCPDTPSGTAVDARGCPVVTDRDGDGVSDDKDLCPNTPANAKVDKDGCPIEITEREVELLDTGKITVRDIHFETAKWDILPESRPILDDIGKVMIQWPRLRIEVGGHADWRGSDAYNLDLSNKRANAVMEYLVTTFPDINREQWTARGYGESLPVASNKTVEGMAKNRRVEFKVLNTEELTKEKERRRLLQKGE